MQQERIREILEPLWNKRFPVKKQCTSAESARKRVLIIRRIRRFPERIDGLVNESLATDSWSAWGVLHQLKGDLIILEPCSAECYHLLD
jgi:hypothetical protein